MFRKNKIQPFDEQQQQQQLTCQQQEQQNHGEQQRQWPYFDTAPLLSSLALDVQSSETSFDEN